MDQAFSFTSVFAAYDQLLLGAGLTMRLTLLSVVLGMVVAVVGAWAKTSGPAWARHIATGYVEVIRNTPFLLQLYFFFFGLPSMGVRLTPNDAALLTMVVNLGAYATEIVRAGVEAVPHGQTEAARALGLRPLQIFRLVILPPALRIIYPPLVGQFTMVLLGSSVVSAISANELASVANSIQSLTFRTFETYFVVTLMYLVLALAFRAALGLAYSLTFGRNQYDRAPAR